jgi:hypothetical protein
MTENRKSLILAGMFIVFVAALITGLISRGHSCPKRKKTARATVIPLRSTPVLTRGADHPERSRNRAEYARWRQKRHARKGQTCTVRVTGDEDRIFVMGWTSQNLDREHMDKLKKAEGHFTLLREKGFKKMVLQVDGREVWSKDL